MHKMANLNRLQHKAKLIEAHGKVCSSLEKVMIIASRCKLR